MRLTCWIGLCVAMAACGGDSDGAPPDSGGALDSGADGSTVDAAPDDGAVPGDDGGGADAGPGDDGGADAGGADAGAAACAGMECTGFPASIERGCTLGSGGADVNCAAEMHQVDCCGTMRAMGMNHGVVGSAFCPAEAACRATYADPAPCSPGMITLDTGETTDDPSLIHVRCNIPSGASSGTCESYLGDATGGTGSCG